jgi:hypothetical protein
MRIRQAPSLSIAPQYLGFMIGHTENYISFDAAALASPVPKLYNRLVPCLVHSGRLIQTLSHKRRLDFPIPIEGPMPDVRQVPWPQVLWTGYPRAKECLLEGGVFLSPALSVG